VLNGFDYKTVFYFMSWDEINEANAALDLQKEAQREAMEKAKAQREINQKKGR
jgi:hypothetical protein